MGDTSGPASNRLGAVTIAHDWAVIKLVSVFCATSANVSRSHRTTDWLGSSIASRALAQASPFSSANSIILSRPNVLSKFGCVGWWLGECQTLGRAGLVSEERLLLDEEGRRGPIAQMIAAQQHKGH
jgi:hypothetical protein